jgi:hypothetical protein
LQYQTAGDATAFILLSVDLKGRAQLLYVRPYSEGQMSGPGASPNGRYLAFPRDKYMAALVMLENFWLRRFGREFC